MCALPTAFTTTTATIATTATAAAAVLPQAMAATTTTTTTATTDHPARSLPRRQRATNWQADFYKNGYPTEVIVIEDSPAVEENFASNARAKRKQEAQSVNHPQRAKRRKNDPPRVVHDTPASTSGRHKSASSSAAVKRVDKDGHYVFKPNDKLCNRYLTIKELGKGTFGKVLECRDVFTNTRYAIKIIRAIPKYKEAGKVEIRVLQRLKEADPTNLYKCIQMRHAFTERDHVCMVFDLLKASVFDFLKNNDFRGFPHAHVQHMAQQLLTSVAFLHDQNLIHTDIKPENLMLMDNRSRPSSEGGLRLEDTSIQLIDFGSATFESEYHSTVVSTRHYRAPEIILGIGWSFPCDIWSVACVLVEFVTGEAYFQTHENQEHLALMQYALGKTVPTRLLRDAKQDIQNLFRADGSVLYPTPRHLITPLQRLLDPNASLFNKHLLALLRCMFVHDPAKRITARDALRHPFFTHVFDEPPTVAQPVTQAPAIAV
ncbi:kinase-like domain-containing protein [Syncephalastrum racemosum]|uniref:Kinase-like domain-containing protein n=1 Tax=Syncephalastrum racemosum TaxID=13706 RepID=A0A1X2HWD6_SYNRA|nr:kinase-like domain-containing protein [Syncephalastrum racemosum]